MFQGESGELGPKGEPVQIPNDHSFCKEQYNNETQSVTINCLALQICYTKWATLHKSFTDSFIFIGNARC